MSTTDDSFNPPEMPLFELVEAPPVTKANALANQFLEAHFDDFAAAELAADKRFLLSAPRFNQFLIDHGHMPEEPAELTEIEARGRGQIRNYHRRMINRSAKGPRGIWPPFSIEVVTPGVMYEVRLLDTYVNRLPKDFMARTMKYMVNRNTDWRGITVFMHSERISKMAPKAALRFMAVERVISHTMRSLQAQLESCDTEMRAAYEDAQKVIAAMHIDDAAAE